jgi:hypothetical protein
MDSWKTRFNAYKISKAEKLRPGRPWGLKVVPRHLASDTVSRPPYLESLNITLDHIYFHKKWSRLRPPTSSLLPTPMYFTGIFHFLKIVFE